MIEQAALLGPRRAIVGIITKPTSTHIRNNTAVLILNAGLTHHVGPGRIHVKLARQLAQSGIGSVRFDFSGIGDSPGRTDNLHVLELATREPQEVMDDLSRQGYENFVLVGICSGAYCAFKSTLQDQRIIGAVMINTMDLSGKIDMDNRVWEQRYFKTSLFSLRAWKNMLTGKINYSRLFSTLLSRFTIQKQKRTDSLVLSEFNTILKNKQRLLFLFSGKDVRVNYLEVLLGSAFEKLKSSGTLVQEIIPDADHIFSRNIDQIRMIKIVSRWIEDLSSDTVREISMNQEKGVD